MNGSRSEPTRTTSILTTPEQREALLLAPYAMHSRDSQAALSRNPTTCTEVLFSAIAIGFFTAPHIVA